jgi:carboxyl-terminal processing protease
LDDAGVLQYAIDSLAGAFDPHSTYMSASQQESFQVELGQRLFGIGASLQDQAGYLTVAMVVGDSPAEKGGLRVGDRILAIAEGEDGLWRNAVGEPLAKCVARIRGPDQSVVRLRMLRAGETASQAVRLVRAPIQFSSLQSALLAASLVDAQRPEKIGYISLPNFYRAAAPADGPPPASSSRDVRQAIENFSGQQAQAIVLDLRSNTGGVLAEVGALTELFAGPGPVLQLRAGDGNVNTISSSEQAAWTGPLVVLADERTGGGGEMLLAALMDRERALVLGDPQTEGNGTSRQGWELASFLRQDPPPKLGTVYITETVTFRINGESIQQAGVRPHVLLPPSRPNRFSLDYVAARDLPNALKFDRINPAAFRRDEKYAVSRDLRLWLRERIAERMANSPQYQATWQARERLAASDGGKIIPLHEDEFAAWQASFGAVEDAPPVPGTRSVRLDYRLREGLASTLDYLDWLKRE